MAQKPRERVTCICDGKKHWVVVLQKRKVLRAAHKTNPYCKAHKE